ncbi:MAG: GntR family transcriptional regulator [Verrucomicrobia bacterium]|nr:GntR family transcriptional regulator [Verrucomicrobiota bacterium]
MHLQLNFKSGKPAYLQLAEQIKYAAATGVLRPGEALPSIRPLAEDLRINRNTVAKAYAELESEGVIETRQGKGCFVTENNSPLRKAVRQEIVSEAIDYAIVQAHHLQIPPEEFIELVKGRLEHFRTETEKPSTSKAGD